MNRYSCLIIIIINLHLVSQSSSLQRNKKGNLFHKVNDDVQNTINKVFELLKLNKNFTSLRKHRVLLTMHATMKKIAENNYPRYKDARRASKLFVKKKIKDVLFNIDKLINILVQENLAPDNLKILSDIHNKPGIDLQLTSLETPENEGESFAILREYLNNLDGSYIDSPLQKIKNEFEKNSQKVKEGRKLKVWKATKTEAETMNQTNSRRVFQGKRANIKKFPFLASIHMLGDFVCAGSIINKLMVITAATCLQRVFYEDNKEIMTVRVGSGHTNRLGTLHNISQIFFHPNYNPETLSNNLAILKIQKELYFKQKTKIRRVDYQRLEGNLHSSVKDVLIVGWGDTNSGNPSGMEQLSYSHLDVYNLQKCIDKYTSKYVNEKNFCTGFTTIGAGACKRDIGAPGIVGGVLVGVVSFGPQVCGTVDAPTVFINLGYYIDWIDSVIKEMNYSTVPLLVTQRKLMRANDLAIDKMEPTIISTIANNKNSPVMKTATSEYPKAIRVLTYLLNKLIASDPNFKEDNEQDYNIVKKAPRSDWIAKSSEMSNMDEEKENEPTFPFYNQNPINNYDKTSPYNAFLMNMLVSSIGGYFKLNRFINFSEVYKSVSDEETEHKFENTNMNYTSYRSNVKNEQAYAPVSSTRMFIESFPENGVTQVTKKYDSSYDYLHYTNAIKRMGITKSELKEENNNSPGLIFENAIPNLEITTQALIFENTNDPDDFKVSKEKSKDLEDNYETDSNHGMSIEMSSQFNLPSATQYKFRTTEGYIGPEYKKDYVFDFITEKRTYEKEKYAPSLFKGMVIETKRNKRGFQPTVAISPSSRSDEKVLQFPNKSNRIRHSYKNRILSTMLNGYNIELEESDERGEEDGRRFLDYINLS